MKYVSEYRDPALAQALLREIHRRVTRPHNVMEICGGQTHTIVRHGLDRLLEPGVRLLHGPGCPVCVTSASAIDHAIAMAEQHDVILCSFGDMVRVPGSSRSLLAARATGSDIRVLYSPLDALAIARENPNRDVVFFAVGFETTAPVSAALVHHALDLGIHNLRLLVAHVLVPPAMETILEADDCEVEAFLAAGHVCTVAGSCDYEPLAAHYRVPIVVTGFEPVDILAGVLGAVTQLEHGQAVVENRYTRAVRRDGNLKAREMVREVFEVCDREWRGIGVIPDSGLRLRAGFAQFDASLHFPLRQIADPEQSPCIAGSILRGRSRPPECSCFGTTCTPDHPLGAPMVSSEGACAAWYSYGRAN